MNAYKLTVCCRVLSRIEPQSTPHGCHVFPHLPTQNICCPLPSRSAQSCAAQASACFMYIYSLTVEQCMQEEKSRGCRSCISHQCSGGLQQAHAHGGPHLGAETGGAATQATRGERSKTLWRTHAVWCCLLMPAPCELWRGRLRCAIPESSCSPLQVWRPRRWHWQT